MANENDIGGIVKIADFAYIEKGQTELRFIPEEVYTTLTGKVPVSGLVFSLDELLGLYSFGPMKGTSMVHVQELNLEFPYEKPSDLFTNLNEAIRGYFQQELPSGIIVAVKDSVDSFGYRTPSGYDYKIFE